MSDIQTKLNNMLNLQDQLNQGIHPEWKKQDYSWPRAIWLEAAELIEHLPWKWWKGKTPDMQQVKIELVDIWHFIMSWSLRDGTTNVLSTMLEHQNPPTKSLIEHSEHIAHGALIGNLEHTVENFLQAAAKAELSFDDMYAMYIGKNVLNQFRQDNGYKAGTYIKMWSNVDGDPEFKEEDNDAMMTILRSFGHTNFTYADVYAKLKERYSKCRELNT